MSMSIDASDVTLGEDGRIFVDGEEVGYLGWSENVLVDITVESAYREQGIATAAVEEMVERMREDGYSKVTTTTVVNPAMESVLQKVGFESSIEETPLYPPEEVPADVNPEDIPTEEEIVWIFYM